MTAPTNGGWIESIPAVDIELLESGIVRVTDKSCLDQDYSVDLHPMQLRLIAEKLGLVREMSASEADTMRTCAELRRRMLALKVRIDHLGKYLALHSDHEHADLSYETDYATATGDIAEAYCADFPVGNASSVTSALPPAASRDVTQCHGDSVTEESRVTHALVTPPSCGTEAQGSAQQGLLV